MLVSKYGRLYETLERAGLTVYAVRTETYEDIFKTVRTLGRLLGLEGRGRAARGPDPEGGLPGGGPGGQGQVPPRVYYEIDPTPYTVGPESFIGVLISKARG